MFKFVFCYITVIMAYILPIFLNKFSYKHTKKLYIKIKT